MEWVTGVLGELGVGGPGDDGRPGPGTFPDGAAFRIEIPSVEGPRVLEAVLQAAEAEGITVNRVSQGSGAMLLRASELRDMAQAGHEAGLEVCLFVGPARALRHRRARPVGDGSAHGDQVRGLPAAVLCARGRAARGRAGHPQLPDRRPRAAPRLTAAQARGDLPAGIVWKISPAWRRPTRSR